MFWEQTRLAWFQPRPPPAATPCLSTSMISWCTAFMIPSTVLSMTGLQIRGNPMVWLDLTVQSHKSRKMTIFIANHPDVRNFASILKMSNSEVLILGGIYAGSKITHSTSLRLKDQTFTAGPDLYKERSAACVSYINPKQAIIGWYINLWKFKANLYVVW